MHQQPVAESHCRQYQQGHAGGDPDRHWLRAPALLRPPGSRRGLGYRRPPESICKSRRIGVTLVGLLPQELLEKGDDSWRQIGGSLQRQRLLVSDGVEDGVAVLATERKLSAQHLVEHDPQRPEVDPMVDRLTSGLFGSHVGRGSQGAPGTRQLRPVEQLRQPEVQQLGAAL